MIGKVSRFATAARNFSMDQPTNPESRWLSAGGHSVVVEDSDASDAEETGRIKLVFRGDSGGLFNTSMFVLTRDGTAFSGEMRMLIGAVLPDVEAQREFRELLKYEATARRVLESFRGMRVFLNLRNSPGYRIEFDPSRNEYVAADAESGEELLSGRALTSLTSELQAAGYRKSYRRIESIEVIDEATKDSNLQAFGSVVASIKKTTAALDSAEDNQFAGYTGTTTGG